MAIILVACSAKEKDCEKDTDSAKAADVQTSEDTTQRVSKDCQDLCAKKGVDGDTCKAYCSGERKKGACYAACEGSAGHCKKVCYGKKPAADVVDSPDDATATRVDTISVPEDVSGTSG